MESLGEWLARHPVMVGAAFACLAGATTYNVFRAGMTYSDLRAVVGARARAASEAMGG